MHKGHKTLFWVEGKRWWNVIKLTIGCEIYLKMEIKGGKKTKKKPEIKFPQVQRHLKWLGRLSVFKWRYFAKLYYSNARRKPSATKNELVIPKTKNLKKKQKRF